MYNTKIVDHLVVITIISITTKFYLQIYCNRVMSESNRHVDDSDE